MNQFQQLMADLGASYRRELTMHRRYMRSGRHTVTKDEAEGEIRDAAMARVLDAVAAFEGKEAVHIMPEEVADLQSAGFKVSTNPVSGVLDVDDPVAEHGRNGDTDLAFVTPGMVHHLLRQGGAGTTNPTTGLREFYSDSGEAAADGMGGDTGGAYGGGESGDTGDASASGDGIGGDDGGAYGGGNTPGGENTGGSGTSMGAAVTEDPDFYGEEVNGINNNPAQTNNPNADPIGAADLGAAIDKARSQNPGLMARAQSYGVDIADLVDRNRTGTNPNMTGIAADVGMTTEARHAHNPTKEQRDLNRTTQKGFAGQNPGVVSGMNAAMGVMGMAVPGVSMVSAVCNMVNAAVGQPTVGFSGLAAGLGVDVGSLSGLAADLGIDVGEVGLNLGEISADVMGAISSIMGSEVGKDAGATGGDNAPGDGHEAASGADGSIADNPSTSPDADVSDVELSKLAMALMALIDGRPGATGTPLDWRL
ncbi:hypothetical protein T8K17_13790 [Thalassobaculum sp. OXR-137]|uniref:hypothetical protein n=1 Tax=Thalassobaculum sp. OXR-137 TaxID=3100173 RepID=UPI002AC8C4FE|nr:hypothetical protein [Thalassobaculum sp. OXR-137]WPZ32312.1 hypothetical protein T8K17_13790 [Thalassobaculum sp. OXR-137]